MRHVAEDADDQAIASAIVGIGKSLRLKTLAEGVETAEQLQWLRSQHCDFAQGYFFSMPLPPDDMAELPAATTVSRGRVKWKNGSSRSTA